MKPRFRLPDEDEDENQEHAEPEEPPDVEDLAPKALILALGAGATQVFWPLPVPFVVLFGLIGAATGLAWLLRVGKWGVMAGVIFCLVMDFFTPSDANAVFLLRTGFLAVAGFGLAVSVGLLIQHARREE